MSQICYLDYNATAPVKPDVVSRMSAVLVCAGNPSSVHTGGRCARRAIEEARENVGDLVGCTPERVVFTSGGTEANNLAVSFRPRVLVSAVEHVSILDAVSDATRIPVNSSGIIDLDALRSALSRETVPALVSVMMANNETGAIQPLGHVAEIAHEFGALCHCDAVQAAGKISFKMDDLGVDLLSLSAHKLGGPQGVGALVLGDDIEVPPIMRGGAQERGRRAGTENVPGIIGFGVAVALCPEDNDARIAGLRDRIERHVTQVAPSATIFAADVPRLNNTSCIVMPGVPSETQVIAFDLAGIAVSAGAACSSGRVARSHVLDAMGADPIESGCAIRVSLGWATRDSDIDRFLVVWKDLHARSRARREPRTATENAVPDISANGRMVLP